MLWGLENATQQPAFVSSEQFIGMKKNSIFWILMLCSMNDITSKIVNEAIKISALVFGGGMTSENRATIIVQLGISAGYVSKSGLEVYS